MSETHGYLPAKLGSTLAGLALAVVGTGMMAGDLWLCWSGTWTTGEVEQVVRRRDGAPEQRFSDEAALLAAEQVDARDRGWTYLPEVVFRDAGGGERRWRPNYGSQLASPWRLADDSGLPTRVAVVYDAADPGRAAMPWDMRLWFVPGAMLCIGLWIAATMGVLAWYAGRSVDEDAPPAPVTPG